MRNITKTIILASSLLLSSTAIAQVWLPVQGEVGGVEFPNRDRSYLTKGDKGQFVNIDNLRQMKKGLSKQEVRKLLAAPHFSEGLGGVSSWNYIFHFRTGQGDAFITCQYQVVYNKEPKYNVGSMHWDKSDCMDLLNKQPEVAAAAAPVESRAPIRSFDLSGDALFHFDRSGSGDLLPGGREEISRVASKLRGQSTGSINVIGHTDRMGSDEYNMNLSESRAATVRDLLIQDGVKAELVSSRGAGESDSTTSCDDNLGRSALISCLQPDRRVEIVAKGE